MFIFDIIGKIILKVIILISLIVLTLFNSILKVATFIFGLLSVPAATIILIVGIVMCFTEGFGADMLMLFSAAAILVGLKYLLPLLPESLDTMKYNLKESLYEPLVVRSPVKYTI